jgi:8-oxo-dGTP diphosphatase
MGLSPRRRTSYAQTHGKFETEHAMAEPAPPRSPIPAVGVVCLRGDEVLLIRRGNPPRKGEWSLPGGRIEWGETCAAAALRELQEETGVTADLVGLVDVIDGLFSQRAGGEVWGHYVLVDYAARWRAGEPRAGDDAADARFFALAEIDALGLWRETVRVIHAAHAMTNTALP